jgi:hypothetical protein
MPLPYHFNGVNVAVVEDRGLGFATTVCNPALGVTDRLLS